MRGTTFYLGAGYRKPALLRLVGALDIRGRRGTPSLSELVGRLADAAEFDFEQTAARLRKVFAVAVWVIPPDDGEETDTSGSRALNVHLGTQNSIRRRAALQRLANYFEISVSMILMRLADAVVEDFEKTAMLVGDIINIAAQSYVATSETLRRGMAEQTPTMGKYLTEQAAKRAASRPAGPIVVRFSDGSFDWFAAGQSVGYVADGRDVAYPADWYRVVARYIVGSGWKTTDQ